METPRRIRSAALTAATIGLAVFLGGCGTLSQERSQEQAFDEQTWEHEYRVAARKCTAAGRRMYVLASETYDGKAPSRGNYYICG